ncbi:MAG: hypothetical protein QW597_06395 [Thermoplasmataceae archaeon]
MMPSYSSILDVATFVPSFMATGLNLSGIIGNKHYASLSLKLSMLIIFPAIITILLSLFNSWISIIFLIVTFILILYSYIYLAIIVDDYAHSARAVDELTSSK